MKLIYASGSNEGKEVELKPPFISLGRETDNDILLTEDEASRYHAKIEKDGSIWIVRDLNSSNGVRLNGQKIDESAPLEHNDELRIGGTVFMFVDPDKGAEADAPAPAPASVETSVESPKPEQKVDKGDDPAQRRIRLMMTALIAMIVAIVGGYLVLGVLEKNKPKPKLSVEQIRKNRLEKAPLHIVFKHEKSGYDTTLNDYNMSVYEVVLENRKLMVRVENLSDEVNMTPDPVDISEDEETELKMALLSGDAFLKAESMAPKERDNSYERISLMVRADNRGNAVEYVNESGLLPDAVNSAIDKIKTMVESKMEIPKMSKAEAFKRAEELYLQASRNYVEKRVHPMNLYKAIQSSHEALVILDDYNQEPDYFLELQKLNRTCTEEHETFVKDMMQKADIEERTDKAKALERYRTILKHIADINDRDYQAAREKVYLLEQAIKKERR